MLIQTIDDLRAKLEEWEDKEEEIDALKQKAYSDGINIREAASKEGEKLFHEAIEKSKDLRKKTESYLEEILTKLQETQKKREAFSKELKSTLDHHYSMLEESEPEEPLTGPLTELLERP